MSRFKKLSHTLWCCQYHIVRVPKYRYRILNGKIGNEVNRCIRAFSDSLKCEIIELNVQIDHVHILVFVPPKVSISKFVGRTAIRVLNQFKHLRKKPYWGNQFWAKGYCVDTVGLDTEIRKYVRYQENKERQVEQLRF